MMSICENARSGPFNPLMTPGVKYLTVDDAHALAKGAAFLGAGGGGDPYTTLLQFEALLQAGKRVGLVELSSVPDDALVAPCGWMGAPTVSLEKLPNGREAVMGLRKLEEIKGQKVFGVFPMEIGGSNGLAPLLLAAECDIPVIDCDGMGRAFPESQMVVFNIYGCSASPVVITDEIGNCIVMETATNHEEERIARLLSIAMGGSCHVIDYSGSGYQMKQNAIRGTVSLAINIGYALLGARGKGQDPFQALLASLSASSYYRYGGVLFDGKVVNLERETSGGFAVGRAVLETFDGKDSLEVGFRNENLVARVNDEIRGMVPDILTFLDRETADPVTTENLRYGQRLKLIGVGVPPTLRTDAALAVLGPRAFAIAEQYRPIEEINAWLP